MIFFFFSVIIEDKVKNVLLGNSVSLHDLYVKAKPLTKEEFSPYGDVIEPVSEEEQCSNGDANLMLNKGTPRSTKSLFTCY